MKGCSLQSDLAWICCSIGEIPLCAESTKHFNYLFGAIASHRSYAGIVEHVDGLRIFGV